MKTPFNRRDSSLHIPKVLKLSRGLLGGAVAFDLSVESENLPDFTEIEHITVIRNKRINHQAPTGKD